MAVCESVKTTRTKDRLRPLQREADKRRNNADARALSTRIATFTATRPGLLLDQRYATTAALHAKLRVALREGMAPADTVGPGSLSLHRQERSQLRGSSSPDTSGPSVGWIR